MKKQSSVDWLVKNMEPNILWTDKAREIFEQAKAMHREETKDYGWMCCFKTTQKNQWSLEQLYNETFG